MTCVVIFYVTNSPNVYSLQNPTSSAVFEGVTDSSSSPNSNHGDSDKLDIAIRVGGILNQVDDIFEFSEGQKYWFTSANDLLNATKATFVVEKPTLESPNVLGMGEVSWEGTYSGYPITIFDEESHCFFMYYRCIGRDMYYSFSNENLFKSLQATCVATSEDGLTYTRPQLSLYPLADGNLTNIIHTGPTSHNFAVFLDQSGLPGTKKFMAIGGVDGFLAADDGIYLFGSDDGLAFSKLKDTPILTRDHDIKNDFHSFYDTMNTVAYDKFRQWYWVWLRRNDAGANQSVYPRHIQFTTFSNLITGSPHPMTFIPIGEDPQGEYYMSCILPVPASQSGSVYAGISIAHPIPDNALILSRDGKRFTKPSGNDREYLEDPFLESRGERNDYHFRYRYSCVPGIHSFSKGEKWLFYFTFFRHHYHHLRPSGETTAVIRAYSVPQWGFTHVHANTGSFFLKPMKIKESSLLHTGTANLHFMARASQSSKLVSRIRFLFHHCTLSGKEQHVDAFWEWTSEWYSVGEAGNRNSSVKEFVFREADQRKLAASIAESRGQEGRYIVWKVELQESSLHALWI